MAKSPLDRTHYPGVERWLSRQFKCFTVSVNRGITYSRIDVLGIRYVGGDYSSDVESIAVEVKRGMTPFTKAAGQAVSYKVYVERVYLADKRDKPFTEDEIAIASNLGIGLVQIIGTKCREVLSSPKYDPIPRLQLRLFRALRLGKCQLCDAFFDLGAGWKNVADGDLAMAVAREKGLIFWLDEMERRKLNRKQISGGHTSKTIAFFVGTVWQASWPRSRTKKQTRVELIGVASPSI